MAETEKKIIQMSTDLALQKQEMGHIKNCLKNQDEHLGALNSLVTNHMTHMLEDITEIKSFMASKEVNDRWIVKLLSVLIVVILSGAVKVFFL